ncbi:PepSY-associated TM helix domain-containing protein [Povalibacter sp.]|uniref:PepSY-associated TM helix domain-containing protein n=1 Tax=Povalibacter sp. TaxID=1962978 RepID=UPI002F3F2E68
MTAAARATTATEQKRRAFWLKHLHQWHWVSAAGCLVGLVLFSITGFTLNHASAITAKPVVSTATATLPAELLRTLQQTASEASETTAVPDDVSRWLRRELAVRVDRDKAEWSDDELYVSLPRPGGDAWMTIDLVSGDVSHERTDRGWISYLNDLHKGRNTGAAWSLFIDAFAFAALIFALTGLVLLKMHSMHRPATWPMVLLGFVLPLLLAILFIH